MDPIYLHARSCIRLIQEAYGQYIPQYNTARLNAMMGDGLELTNEMKKYINVVRPVDWTSEDYWKGKVSGWRMALDSALDHHVPAFTLPLAMVVSVTPEHFSEHKRIYVKQNPNAKPKRMQHVLVHELLHWLTHKRFITELTYTEETRATLKEGPTEALARRIMNLTGETGVYDDESSTVRGVMQAAGLRPRDLARAYLSGPENNPGFDGLIAALRTGVEIPALIG